MVLQLEKVVSRLDQTFDIYRYGPDSAFSRFIPEAYKDSNFNWKQAFEPSFCTYFNGLMIKGDENVKTYFLQFFQQMMFYIGLLTQQNKEICCSCIIH
jgi:hypothetical protein